MTPQQIETATYFSLSWASLQLGLLGIIGKAHNFWAAILWKLIPIVLLITTLIIGAYKLFYQG